MHYEINQLDRHGVETAVERARREGWNPGLRDAEAFNFATVDFSGVYVEGKLAATISLVRYSNEFAFLGF